MKKIYSTCFPTGAVFGFDRLTVWRVCPGQMIEERLVGGRAAVSTQTHLSLRSVVRICSTSAILGPGAGERTLTYLGAKKKTIERRNVLLVDRKMKAIERSDCRKAGRGSR